MKIHLLRLLLGFSAVLLIMAVLALCVALVWWAPVVTVTTFITTILILASYGLGAELMHE